MLQCSIHSFATSIKLCNIILCTSTYVTFYRHKKVGVCQKIMPGKGGRRAGSIQAEFYL